MSDNRVSDNDHSKNQPSNNRQPQSYRALDTARPGDPLVSLRQEMNRMFDDVFRGLGFPPMARRGEHGVMMLAPNIDVSETDHEFKIRADLPGVEKDDVEISLDEDVLTIKAERKQERRDGNDGKQGRESYHVVERSYGMFQRSLRLPANIDANHVGASFERGVLTVRVPKTEAGLRSRRISIEGEQGARQPGQQTHRKSSQASGEGAEVTAMPAGEASRTREDVREGDGRPTMMPGNGASSAQARPDVGRDI